MDDRTRRSRERTDRTLVALATDHGAFPVRELVWERSPAEHDRLVERFEADAAGGAGVWTRGTTPDGDPGVVCVRREGEAAWSEPGGKREPGETFREAAVRETHEEAGIDVGIEGVLTVHVVTHVAPERPPVVSPIVVFDGRHGTGVPDPGDSEIAEARWFTERPEPALYDDLRTFPMG
jgi:8-oxo-dGTP diphosphatase